MNLLRFEREWHPVSLKVNSRKMTELNEAMEAQRETLEWATYASVAASNLSKQPQSLLQIHPRFNLSHVFSNNFVERRNGYQGSGICKNQKNSKCRRRGN